MNKTMNRVGIISLKQGYLYWNCSSGLNVSHGCELTSHWQEYWWLRRTAEPDSQNGILKPDMVTDGDVNKSLSDPCHLRQTHTYLTILVLFLMVIPWSWWWYIFLFGMWRIRLCLWRGDKSVFWFSIGDIGFKSPRHCWSSWNRFRGCI